MKQTKSKAPSFIENGGDQKLAKKDSKQPVTAKNVNKRSFRALFSRRSSKADKKPKVVKLQTQFTYYWKHLEMFWKSKKEDDYFAELYKKHFK